MFIQQSEQGFLVLQVIFGLEGIFPIPHLYLRVTGQRLGDGTETESNIYCNFIYMGLKTLVCLARGREGWEGGK
jgi:hypothetical protein